MKQTNSTKTMYFIVTFLDYVVVSCFLLMVVLFRLLMVPVQIVKTFMNVEITEQGDEAQEVKMINAIRQWVANHENDIADATESFGAQESYFAKITPKNNDAATLTIEIGYPKYLRVSIENFGIEFDEDELDQGENLLNDILLSYENGKYYLKKWLFEGVVVDKALIIELENGKRYSSKTDEFKVLRKWLAKVKQKRFSAIASLEAS